MLSESVPLSRDYEGQEEDTPLVDLHENPNTALPRPILKLYRAYMWKDVILLLLVAGNLLLGVISWPKLGSMNIKASSQSISDKLFSPIVPPEAAKELFIPMRWANEYSSATTAGMDEVDRNWDNIDASIGLVSISHDLAAKQGLPASMDDPRDPRKGVYTLEGYHSLHCLTVIRRTMFQLAKGEKLDVPFGHSTHCLGSLLQAILCNADTTLLYQKAGRGAGDGQIRKCRNWPAMRDWAREQSACMKTNSSGIANLDVEGCDEIKAGDGVLLSDWPER
ncbi:uncharacterized protein F4822DRAFT_99977 [Hypoxylon trugodes]|uniref:uncharacterized protein n=1 Tax=Hypoxylon trugodes TaxID=326681 RepID=UPI00219F035C|nr:uncharacterized protein F4822DRAFT_99977 [Hypoxylon trugodes]KAI1382874.1 hypothetical protein F4822DRAFT_99977 [Hypoxylon trugodes]